MEQFEQVGEYDLVLTTYALLPRDEERWRQHAFHLVILDEVHYIKNPRSKVAQSASMLNTWHRLCLTGAQRDLESVRLVMDKKVREEVAKKGVARSHIVILEALLKLR